MRGLNVARPLPHLAIVGIRLVVKWQLVLLTVTHSESIQLLDPESIVWIETSARKKWLV